MNLLSALSIMICTAFFIGAWHTLFVERKGSLNATASAVLLSLGWWSFCNAFFFAATTQAQAWFWHRLGCLGWCGFVALTAFYFVVLTYRDKAPIAGWKIALFFAPALLLICRNLFGETTSLAQGFVQSAGGLGLTYINSPHSFWLWAYLVYVAVYFGLAFFLLCRWAKAARHKLKREMAVLFIVLDTFTVLCGVLTDVIMPLTKPLLPAMASIATAVFGIGYFTIICRRDLFNINLVVSSEYILQTGNNAVFVVDENQELLKCNRAVEHLLGCQKAELLGTNFADLLAEPLEFAPLYVGEVFENRETKLRCKDGSIKDVLLSATIARDRRNSFLCTIVSCQDVSPQKKVQAELALEREKYKCLADDYQRLASFDPLTGLANRRSLVGAISAFETRYRAEGADFSALFLDLDNFKLANDKYGHRGGDRLLVAAAQKLTSCTGEGEFLARMGGDEFVMLLPYADPHSVTEKLAQIRAEFRRSIPVEGQPYQLEVSVGYGVFSQIGDTAKLMDVADAAMYGSKKSLLT